MKKKKRVDKHTKPSYQLELHTKLKWNEKQNLNISNKPSNLSSHEYTKVYTVKNHTQCKRQHWHTQKQLSIRIYAKLNKFQKLKFIYKVKIHKTNINYDIKLQTQYLRWNEETQKKNNIS